MFRVFGVEQGNILKSSHILLCGDIPFNSVSLELLLSRCVYFDPQLGVSDFFLL